MTGRELESRLLDACRANDRITLLEDHLGLELIRGDHLGFAVETSSEVSISGELFQYELESHLAIKLGVAGQVHCSHAAAVSSAKNSGCWKTTFSIVNDVDAR